MTEKRLVVRDESARTHIYERRTPQIRRSGSRDRPSRRAFDGSAAKLVLHALAANKTSPEELAEIRSCSTPSPEDPNDSLLEIRRLGADPLRVARMRDRCCGRHALRLAERRSASVRYVIACVGLAAMLAAPHLRRVCCGQTSSLRRRL